MPWKLHRKLGSSNRTNRVLDRPLFPWISHKEWRRLTHNPLGIALIKIALGKKFSIPEAVNHVLVDNTLPYKTRKTLANLLEKGK